MESHFQRSLLIGRVPTAQSSSFCSLRKKTSQVGCDVRQTSSFVGIGQVRKAFAGWGSCLSPTIMRNRSMSCEKRASMIKPANHYTGPYSCFFLFHFLSPALLPPFTAWASRCPHSNFEHTNRIFILVHSCMGTPGSIAKVTSFPASLHSIPSISSASTPPAPCRYNRKIRHQHQGKNRSSSEAVSSQIATNYVHCIERKGKVVW